LEVAPGQPEDFVPLHAEEAVHFPTMRHNRDRFSLHPAHYFRSKYKTYNVLLSKIFKYYSTFFSYLQRNSTFYSFPIPKSDIFLAKDANLW
jgi:hypothetical protein